MTTPLSSPEFGDYEDPEDIDWIAPAVPLEADLPDNTRAWGPFYRWAGPSNRTGWLLSLAVTREIHPPWHVGFGICIRRRHGRAFALGVWRKSKPPQILNMEPAEQDLHMVITKADRLDKLHTD